MNCAADFRIDFLVPGFSKCGTTTLCELLAEHPGIFIPPGEAKEPLYFIRENSQAYEPAYRELFAAATPGQLLAEGSTFYSSHQHEHGARERIFRHNPDMKLIWIVRDPLARIESSFREFHHSGHRFAVDIPFGFEQALEQVPALIRDSCYWARYGCYRERFDDTRMLVVFLEELRAQPRVVLRQCYEFLGVDPAFCNRDPHLRLNPGEAKLRDTRLLRWLRHHRPSAGWIAALSAETQNRLFRRALLRRPMRAPVIWSERARQRVREELLEDALALLSYSGREPSVWPRFTAQLQ